MLDSECARVAGGGCAATSTQVTWADGDLAANASKNLIVIWHQPRWSSGVTNLVDVQPFWDLAYRHGAEIVLVGHDHVYERLAPSNASGVADPPNGVRQFTVGTGGAAVRASRASVGTVRRALPASTASSS